MAPLFGIKRLVEQKDCNSSSFAPSRRTLQVAAINGGLSSSRGQRLPGLVRTAVLPLRDEKPRPRSCIVEDRDMEKRLPRKTSSSNKNLLDLRGSRSGDESSDSSQNSSHESGSATAEHEMTEHAFANLLIGLDNPVAFVGVRPLFHAPFVTVVEELRQSLSRATAAAEETLLARTYEGGYLQSSLPVLSEAELAECGIDDDKLFEKISQRAGLHQRGGETYIQELWCSSISGSSGETCEQRLLRHLLRFLSNHGTVCASARVLLVMQPDVWFQRRPASHNSGLVAAATGAMNGEGQRSAVLSAGRDNSAAARAKLREPGKKARFARKKESERSSGESNGTDWVDTAATARSFVFADVGTAASSAHRRRRSHLRPYGQSVAPEGDVYVVGALQWLEGALQLQQQGRDMVTAGGGVGEGRLPRAPVLVLGVFQQQLPASSPYHKVFRSWVLLPHPLVKILLSEEEAARFQRHLKEEAQHWQDLLEQRERKFSNSTFGAMAAWADSPFTEEEVNEVLALVGQVKKWQCVAAELQGDGAEKKQQEEQLSSLANHSEAQGDSQKGHTMSPGETASSDEYTELRRVALTAMNGLIPKTNLRWKLEPEEEEYIARWKQLTRTVNGSDMPLAVFSSAEGHEIEKRDATAFAEMPAGFPAETCAAETRNQKTVAKRRAFPAVLPPPPLVFRAQESRQGQVVAPALQIPPFQGVLSTFGIDNSTRQPDVFPPVLIRCACCRCAAKREVATQGRTSNQKLCVDGEGAAQNRRMRRRKPGRSKRHRSRGRGGEKKSSEEKQRRKDGGGCSAECGASSTDSSSGSSGSGRCCRVARSLSRTARSSSKAPQRKKIGGRSAGEDKCSSCSCFCLERRETFWKGLKPGEGKSILICGPMGSGKSMLLRTLATALINSTESWNSSSGSQKDKRMGGAEGGGQWASRQRGGVLFSHVGELLHGEIGASQRALVQLFATAAGRDAIICLECIDVILGVAGRGRNEEPWIEDERGEGDTEKRDAEKEEASREKERERRRQGGEIFKIAEEEEQVADADDPVAALQGELMQLFITLVDLYVRQRGITLLCTITTRPLRLPPQLSRCFTDTILLDSNFKK